MKSPLPLLLYLTSAGLFGLAGWTVYEMLPMWKDSVRVAATQKGQDEGTDLLGKGKGQQGVSAQWLYSRSTADWWATFRDANLIGKLPPPPPTEVKDDVPKEPPPKPVKPLEEIFELVAIVHDSEGGLGGNSQVILRYKPEANVQPPEWYVRENSPPAASAGPVGPRDTTPNRAGSTRPATTPPPKAGTPTNPARPNAPTSAMPVSSVGREQLQRLWIDDGGDPRRSPKLWEPYSDIRLVRVAPDAQSAFFVRTPPPPKAGETAPAPKEEEMFKTSLNLSQDILGELARLQRQGAASGGRTAQAPVKESNKWTEVEETTVVGNTVNIGRKDEKRFRENSDEFLNQLNLDTYVSKSSNLKGLQVRNVDRQLAAQYGIQETDVLVEINGRPVQTKAQAMQLGKADYQRGVRTFNTKWWSNGQMVERVYQAPDK